MCLVNMTCSKRVSNTCPIVSCPTHRIHNMKGGLDVSGDLVEHNILVLLTRANLYAN
jgi:hypothetical protein